MDYNQEGYHNFQQSQQSYNNDFNFNQILNQSEEQENNNNNFINQHQEQFLNLNDDNNQSLFFYLEQEQLLQQQQVPRASISAIPDHLIDPSFLLTNSTTSTTPLIQVNNSIPSSSASSSSFVPPPTGKRLPSCSACRMRRVKCERIGSSLDCTKCLEKGLTCVAMPKSKSKNTTRTGKRIEQVQALFGKESNSNSNDLNVVDSSPTTKKRKLLSHDSLGNTSVVARLVTSELEGALSASLLDLYYKLPQSRIPILDGLDFRSTFEKAGRRMSQMESQSEVLCSVILSIAARVSAHPLLIGANAPDSSQLTNAYINGQDLTEYGRKRESACIALTENAMKLADARGTMRSPSLESVGTLLLLEGLVGDIEGGDASARSYAAAYLSHVRYILEHADSEANRIPLMESGIGWMIYAKDAFASAFTGAPPAFTNDDLPLLRRKDAPDIIPLAELFDGDGKLVKVLDFWPFFYSYLFHATGSANLIRENLSSPRARRNSRIDLVFIENLISRFDLAIHATSFLVQSAASLFGPYELASNQAKMSYGFVGAMTASRCRLAFLLEGFLSQHLAKKGASIKNVTSLVEIGESGEEKVREEKLYWEMVERSYGESLIRATVAAREVVSDLSRHQRKRGLGVGIMSGIQHLYSRLPDVAMLIARHPSFEEPGGTDPSFTFKEKLNNLKTILTSFYTIGFSFPKFSSSIPLIQAEIDRVTLAQLLYQYNTAPKISNLAPPHPATTSFFDELQTSDGIDWTFSSYDPNSAEIDSNETLDCRTTRTEFDTYYLSPEDGNVLLPSTIEDIESPEIFDNSKTTRLDQAVEAREVDDVLTDLLSNLLR